MSRQKLDHLLVFMTVAEAKSFTRAASQLGISQSALSHTIKGLETEMGVPLLARTTRSVATTAAGERLLERLRPAMGDIDAALEDLRASRDKPSGTVRITTMKHTATSVLLPALPAFFAKHPDVTVELSVDEGLVDIVASRFDAGVRFGESVDRDMVAVPISGEMRTAVVAAPSYFEKYPKPRVPRDLVTQKHNCINFRFETARTLYTWEFADAKGRPLSIKVTGSLIVNDGDVMMKAALQGQGLAYMYEDMVAAYLADGQLVRVLEKYSEPFPGYFLYYPSARKSPALTAFIEAIRYRPRATGKKRR